MSTFDDRIIRAMQRIRDGHGSMRIPADPSDPDLVLAEAAKLLASLRVEVERLTRERDVARALADANGHSDLVAQRDRAERERDEARDRWTAIATLITDDVASLVESLRARAGKAEADAAAMREQFEKLRDEYEDEPTYGADTDLFVHGAFLKITIDRALATGAGAELLKRHAEELRALHEALEGVGDDLAVMLTSRHDDAIRACHDHAQALIAKATKPQRGES